MKKIKRLIAGVLLTLSIISLVGCGAKTTANDNTVLAEVNGKQILLSDVDLELGSFIDYLKQENGDNFEEKLDEQTRIYFNSQRATVLNQLIQEEILLLKAKELNLEPTEEELTKSLQQRINELEAYYGGKEELEEIKKTYNYTDEEFNTMLKNQIIQEIVIEDVTKDVEVTEDEIKEYYEEYKDTYFTQNPGATAQHILFEKEEDAQKCLDEINAGKTTFEEAFKLYEENKEKDELPLAESLGFVEFEQEGFDKDFLAGFKEVKENEISKPVKSSFGYHLIKATKIQKDKTTINFEEVKDDIKENILYEKQYKIYNEKLTEWKEELGVKITADVIGYNPEEE